MSVVLVTSDRFADHLTPPGHPERVERAETMQVVASRWRQQGGEVVAPREATDEDLLRVHGAAYVEALEGARPRRDARRRHVLVAGIRRGRPARRGCGADGGRSRARRRPGSERWSWCGRRATTPKRTARWASVFTTTSPLGRRGLVRAASRASPSSTTTCITATAPSGCSMTIRRVLFVSSHQYPFYPGTGAAGETGQGCRHRLHRQFSARGRRDRRRLRSRLQRGGHPAARAVSA